MNKIPFLFSNWNHCPWPAASINNPFILKHWTFNLCAPKDHGQYSIRQPRAPVLSTERALLNGLHGALPCWIPAIHAPPSAAASHSSSHQSCNWSRSSSSPHTHSRSSRHTYNCMYPTHGLPAAQAANLEERIKQIELEYSCCKSFPGLTTTSAGKKGWHCFIHPQLSTQLPLESAAIESLVPVAPKFVRLQPAPSIITRSCDTTCATEQGKDQTQDLAQGQILLSLSLLTAYIVIVMSTALQAVQRI